MFRISYILIVNALFFRGFISYMTEFSGGYLCYCYHSKVIIYAFGSLPDAWVEAGMSITQVRYRSHLSNDYKSNRFTAKIIVINKTSINYVP